MPVPTKTKSKLFKGSISLLTDTIKVMLLNNSHSINVATHEFISDVSANQITGTGYTAGGATLGTKTVSEDNTTNESVFTAANPTWATSTITAYYAVYYKDTGTPSTSPILCEKSFGGAEISSGSDFIIQHSASGILRF